MHLWLICRHPKRCIRTVDVENRTSLAAGQGNGTHPSIASGIVVFALSRGLTLTQLTDVTGVRGEDLVDPTTRLPDEIVPRIWQVMVDHAPDGTPLSIDMARVVPPSFFADIAHGVQFASTFREASELIVKHRRILADRAHAEMVFEGDEVALLGHHPLDEADGGRTLEVAFALSLRLMSEILTEPLQVLRVEFAHAPMGTPDDYDAVFGAQPVFHAARSALIFPKSALDIPIRCANSELFAYVSAHLTALEARLGRVAAPDPLAALRAAVVDAGSRGDFRPEAVAESAGLGYRQAQRLAAAHGTTLGRLLDDHRLGLAIERLRGSDETMDSIAQRLGYADDRSFRRAFKRQHGIAPSTFRKRARGLVSALSKTE